MEYLKAVLTSIYLSIEKKLINSLGHFKKSSKDA